GHVFRTINGGVSWTDISGDLPVVPAWKLQLDPAGPVLYVANDIGVYLSTDLGVTWTRFGAGLPNAQVRDLDLEPGVDVLAAGSQRRGLWPLKTDDCAAALQGTALQVTCGPLNDNLRLRLNANDPTMLEVVRNSTVLSTWTVGSFQNIVVNTAAGDDTLTVDF